MPEAVIVAAARTPIGRADPDGPVDVDAFELGAVAVRAVLERAGVPASDVDDIVLAEQLQGGGVIARNVAVRRSGRGPRGSFERRSADEGLRLSPERTYDLLRELVAERTARRIDERVGNHLSADASPRLDLQRHERSRRSQLHLRVGNALEPMLEAGSSQLVGQIAYHFARANETEKGIGTPAEAGDIATRSLAHAEATEFYRTAIELLDLSGADESHKAEVREKLADAYTARTTIATRCRRSSSSSSRSRCGITGRERAPTSRG